MTTLRIDIDDEIASLAGKLEAPLEHSVNELIVLELHRRGAISGGKAAELLEMDRLDYIRKASAAGIPYIDMTPEEWEAELATVERMLNEGHNGMQHESTDRPQSD